MKAKFFKAQKVHDLELSIKDNLELYRTGNFNLITSDPDSCFDSLLEIDESKLLMIHCEIGDHKEIENCILMYEAMGALSHYLARDERLWTYLTHTTLLEYTRVRWPIPTDEEKAIKHIKNHFFCKGARGVERDNASSRLWWMASLCNRANGLSLEESLTSLLHQTDVRANIIERPTTSQNVNIFTVVLKKLNDSYKSDKKLFERERFRSFMKSLNLVGGVKLLDALPEAKIANIVDDCISREVR
jgi:hypothetical protein